jgi:hypothetical protein
LSISVYGEYVDRQDDAIEVEEEDEFDGMD